MEMGLPLAVITIHLGQVTATHLKIKNLFTDSPFSSDWIRDKNGEVIGS